MRWRFAGLVAGVVLTATACGYSDPYASTSPIANESPGRATPSPGFDDFHAGDGLTPIVFPDGLKSIDLKVGTGAVARSGDDATVQYTGWLADGTMFDSSRVRNQAFDFTIGQGQADGPQRGAIVRAHHLDQDNQGGLADLGIIFRAQRQQIIQSLPGNLGIEGRKRGSGVAIYLAADDSPNSSNKGG